MQSVWRAESSPGKQLLTAIGCGVTGAVLVYGFRASVGQGMAGHGLTNELAGFLLGVMLLVIGVMALASHGKQSVTIDPQRRRIVVEDHTVFGSKKKVIAFDEITQVGIGYLGRQSSHVTFYYLNLELRSGKTYPLFAPGRFYAGSSSRYTVDGWRQRLEVMLTVR